jgi:negative regulator of flagellin synthesis FlgM
MAMRVSDAISFPDSQDPTNQIGDVNGPKVQNQPANVGFAEDETDLSASLHKVGELKTQLANLPDVRQERVQQLQEAITSGTYEVGAGKIADAMMTDLAGPPQGS